MFEGARPGVGARSRRACVYLSASFGSAAGVWLGLRTCDLIILGAYGSWLLLDYLTPALLLY